MLLQHQSLSANLGPPIAESCHAQHPICQLQRLCRRLQTTLLSKGAFARPCQQRFMVHLLETAGEVLPSATGTIVQPWTSQRKETPPCWGSVLAPGTAGSEGVAGPGAFACCCRSPILESKASAAFNSSSALSRSACPSQNPCELHGFAGRIVCTSTASCRTRKPR